MVFGFLKRIKEFFKKKQLVEVVMSDNNDVIWVNTKEGCVFRLQGLYFTNFVMETDPMMDIKIRSMNFVLLTSSGTNLSSIREKTTENT